MFSAFPGGWPGVGLLLLRGFVGFSLLAETAAHVITSQLSASGWIVSALSAASAACLLVGFLTPVVAIGVTLGVSALALAGVLHSSVEILVLTVAIALLGPGAFSLDARLFGRREIFITKGRPQAGNYL